MADPRNELADIVVPVAPEIATAGSGLTPWVPVGALAAAVCIVLVAWAWRRRPSRALRRLANDVAQRHDTLPALAARLDAWARRQFRLHRVDAAGAPPGIDPAAWSAWANTLIELRFAPPRAEGFETLAALCATARSWGRHA